MHIDVVANIGEARSDEFIHKTVIVIDVLRATSTMIAALSNGCQSIIPVETVLQAKELHKPGDLLGGERYCKKIFGFHLGNSPQEYTRKAVEGRRIILTTTNGTRGIQKATKAEHVLAGALTNSNACANTAVHFKRDVVILCAGTQDVFSLEDGLCAGLILDELSGILGTKQLTINDFGLAMQSCYLQTKDTLLEALLACTNGKKLCKLGFQEDLISCSKVNSTEHVPILERHQLVLHTK
ncbi:2-phosphosulfolactate phosphatase [Paenibacillus sp. SYP-B3998]|uniref:Probable 2-phosphosulfolactate phosphatase n=1 Tax=Paenibacillus sp. SYP-B3998 TaxID=2678564 RepID=A0A6G3ZVT6_9BACL|nr:2-phosphosulfolactate phosphatase [Paenibacillus sp. SYP-B3998]NEW06225.1 2-phosphosulfolactate phosphatase [Paenibacillus sp. SYP-B3998]